MDKIYNFRHNYYARVGKRVLVIGVALLALEVLILLNLTI